MPLGLSPPCALPLKSTQSKRKAAQALCQKLEKSCSMALKPPTRMRSGATYSGTLLQTDHRQQSTTVKHQRSHCQQQHHCCHCCTLQRQQKALWVSVTGLQQAGRQNYVSCRHALANIAICPCAWSVAPAMSTMLTGRYQQSQQALTYESCNTCLLILHVVSHFDRYLHTGSVVHHTREGHCCIHCQ